LYWEKFPNKESFRKVRNNSGNHSRNHSRKKMKDCNHKDQRRMKAFNQKDESLQPSPITPSAGRVVPHPKRTHPLWRPGPRGFARTQPHRWRSASRSLVSLTSASLRCIALRFGPLRSRWHASHHGALTRSAGSSLRRPLRTLYPSTSLLFPLSTLPCASLGALPAPLSAICVRLRAPIV
jgi:hypothetical protein